MTGIAIFVKTPGLSPTKTRLAKTIGQAKAEVWHRLSAQAVGEVALKADIGPVYFAVAEKEGMAHPFWSSHDRLLQCAGDLGKRMADIHTCLVCRHGAGLLLGADTPQISTMDLRRAHQWLNDPSPRQVLGPSADGGFWLFGANHSIEHSLWDQVRYSTPSTRDEFEAAMADQGELIRLKEHTDVDEITDLPIAHQALSQLDHPSPKQVELINWLASSALELP